jgi:DNA-binding CsgD family transcriptional regulator/PAS domain-containing protein
MSPERDGFSDLAALAYEAAIESSLWPQVAFSAAKAFDAAVVGFGIVDRRSGRVLGSFWNDSDFAGCVAASYPTSASNPAVSFAVQTPPLTVANGLMSSRAMEGLAFYNEVMRPRALWETMAVNVHRDEEALAPMALFRERTQPWFGESARAAMRRLAPHLNRAVRVTLKLGEMETRAEALAEMSNRALTGILLTDARGRIAEANGPARAILAEGDGLRIRDGILRAARGDDGAKLARLIHEAAGARTLPMSGVMQVERPSCRRPLAVVVSPTRAAASPFGRSHAVTIAFADPERAPEADGDLLARLYGFTAREAAVAALLVRGRSPGEAADELAMTENTVRTHIRHVFDKTGVERLADLVRLLMQGPGVRGR